MVDTAQARNTRLPVQLTSYIGRALEQLRLRHFLLQTDVRLLTLVGAPGIGKTRLALQVTRDLSGEFADGIYFVPLSPFVDRDQVICAIIRELGILEAPELALLEQVKLHLQDKHTLLVLDNFEQVIEQAGPLVLDILGSCPLVKVLVTSREPLRVRGEQEFSMSPLHLPDPDSLRDPKVETLAHCEAITLFVDRACSVKPDFCLTSANVKAVAEICIGLDGLPLAIELAAVRIKLLTPHDIRDRLGQSGHQLELLTVGPRDMPERQRTLRSAIEWSYMLLDEAEKRLLCRLGVFKGGCSLEAAEGICNADGAVGESILNGVTGLIDKSLVYKVEREKGEATATRLALLETIREFAFEHLPANGEADEVGRLHAGFYLALAEEAEPKLRTAEQTRWLDVLEEDQANFGSAVYWYIQAGDYERALRIAAAMWRFWWMRGPIREGQTYLQRLLSASTSTSTSTSAAAQVSSRVRGRALTGLSWLLLQTNDYEQAIVVAEQAVNALAGAEDEWSLAEALASLGTNMVYAGNNAEGLARSREGLALRRKLGDIQGLARSLNNLGETLRYQGNYGEANNMYTEALSIFLSETKDDWGAGLVLLNMVHIAMHENDYGKAVALLEQAFSLQGVRENKGCVAALTSGLGELLLRVGEKSQRATTLNLSARLLAASDFLRATVGISIDEADLPDYEQACERVRKGLSEQELRKATEEARSLTLEQVVELAVGTIRLIREAQELPHSREEDASARFLTRLTVRERELAELVGEGRSNKEIAEALTVTKRTVETHIGNILSKLGFTSRAQIVAWAINSGLVKSSR